MRKANPRNRQVKTNGEEFSVHTKYQYGIPFTPEEQLAFTLCTRLKSTKSKHKTAATVEGRSSIMFKNARQRARLYGVAFTLTEEWIRAKVSAGVCERTGLPFSLAPSTTSRANPFCPSLDKIDPAGSYSEENVRCVVWIANVAKQDFSDEDLMTFALALVRMQMATGVTV